MPYQILDRQQNQLNFNYFGEIIKEDLALIMYVCLMSYK